MGSGDIPISLVKAVLEFAGTEDTKTSFSGKRRLCGGHVSLAPGAAAPKLQDVPYTNHSRITRKTGASTSS